MNIAKQRKLIEAYYSKASSTACGGYSVNYFSEKWEMPKFLENILGPEGYIEKRIHVDAEVSLRGHGELERLEAQFHNSFERLIGIDVDYRDFDELYKVLDPNSSEAASMRSVKQGHPDVSIEKYMYYVTSFRSSFSVEFLKLFSIRGNRVVLRPDVRYAEGRFTEGGFYRVDVTYPKLYFASAALKENEKRMSPRPFLNRYIKRAFGPLYGIVKNKPEFKTRKEELISCLAQIEQKVSQNKDEMSGVLRISALPEDVLTASVSSGDWTSCFSPRGCNRLVPLHLLQDGQGVMISFIPDDHQQTIEFGGEEVRNKFWRRWAFFIDGYVLLSKRAYPFESETLNDMSQDILLSLLPTDSYMFDEGESDNIYVEGLYFDSVKVVARPANSHKCSFESEFQAIGIPCASCGHCSSEYGSEGIDTIICRECHDEDAVYCYRCEERISDDEVYSDIDGDSYCEHCIERCFTCVTTRHGSEFVGEEHVAWYDGEGYYIPHVERLLFDNTYRCININGNESYFEFSLPGSVEVEEGPELDEFLGCLLGTEVWDAILDNY